MALFIVSVKQIRDYASLLYFLYKQISAIFASILRQLRNKQTLSLNANVGLLHVLSEHTGEWHTVHVWRFSACSMPEEQNSAHLPSPPPTFSV